MHRLIAELDAISHAGPDQVDPDSLAHALISCVSKHYSHLAIVLWSFKEAAPSVVLEKGLGQFTPDGKFQVGANHLELLRECGKLCDFRSVLLPGDTNTARLRACIFPFLQHPHFAIIEFILDDTEYGFAKDAIDAIGNKLCELLSLLAPATPPTKRLLAGPKPSPELDLHQVDRFLRGLYEQLSTKQVAMVAATDGRVLSGCDRLSVIVFRGSGCKVLAISHVETIQRRSGLLRSMRSLANLARHRTSRCVLEGESEQCPPNMVDAYSDFVAESRAQRLALIPLIPSNEVDKLKHELAHRRPISPKPIGLLMVEQFTASEEFTLQLERLDFLASHISNALRTASDYESVLLLPLWKGLGSRLRWLLGYPKIAIASAVMSVVAICISLAMIPATYRVHAEGKAMPAIQHEVYAKVDGVVSSVLVASGQKVKKGDRLLLLDNKELELELLESHNKVLELSSKIASLGVQLDAARQKGEFEQELTVEGERATAVAELEGTEKRVKILEERIGRLEVNSEYNGVVVTFRPEEYLLNRPVRQGDLLLEVMEDDGPWRLELDVSEYRMGHVLGSVEKYGPLAVRYIAMTEVSQPRNGVLADVATRSDHNERQGAYVRAYASIQRNDIPNNRIGAEVSAKIHCPGYSLFYSLFGDIVEFVERNFWL